jgi:ATP-binding cassette, subfamily C, bacterial CydC
MTHTLRRLLDLAAVPRSRLALAAALGAATVVFGAGLMATAGYLISRAAERPPILALTTAIVAVRFFGIARPLARYLERLAGHDVALRALARVRARMYRRIEPLAPAGLEGYVHGDLLARMVADVDALQGLHPRVLVPPLVALGAGATAIGAATAVLPAAGLVLAGGLLAAGIVVPVVAGSLHEPSGGRRAAARAELSAELVELLRGAPELAVYGAGAGALRRIRAADRALVSAARRDAWVGGLADGLGLAVAGATVAGVLALAVGAHASGELDRALIAMLALLALASFEAVQPLAAAARELTGIAASGRRVLELVDRAPPVADPTDPAPPPTGPIRIALEGVRARHGPGGPPVLDGFDLRLDPGRRIALVGASGAGKTTVVNLLLRFLDPEQGRVTLCGRDLREYRQDDVRRTMAVVGQESHLFSASVRENVRLARPQASDADVERVLRRARLWTWVRELPEGLDTHVGEEGRALSGGQRQRLALARALLTDAPVLVLDEPTAHLDPPTAERLMADLLSAAGTRSVLLITHRPEGLELVDDVVDLGARD